MTELTRETIEDLRALLAKADLREINVARSDPAEGADVWWIVANNGHNRQADIGSLAGGYPTELREARAKLFKAAINALPALLDRAEQMIEESCACPPCQTDGPHSSDCAVHNAPGMPTGPCNCKASLSPTLSSGEDAGLIEQLKLLCDPKAEILSDKERIDRFVERGLQAASRLSTLSAELAEARSTTRDAALLIVAEIAACVPLAETVEATKTGATLIAWVKRVVARALAAESSVADAVKAERERLLGIVREFGERSLSDPAKALARNIIEAAAIRGA